MTLEPPSRPRLALARPAGHPLMAEVDASGWVPVPHDAVKREATGGLPPIPLTHAKALLVLSPGGAEVVAPLLPPDLWVLAQGEATARALGEHGRVLVAAEPRAEALWALLQSHLPEGGDVLLARGERTRGHLEGISAGTPWRLHPWITHREVPSDLPLPPVEGVLALSPLQAELLAQPAAHIFRFAWGARSAEAFRAAGHPAHGVCEPDSAALRRLLAAFRETRPPFESHS